MSTRIKFCGMVTPWDVELARDAGADAFGMIFAPSARRIDLDAAREIARACIAGIEPVAVLVDPSEDEIARVRELFPDALLQFSGREPAQLVRGFADRAIKAIHVGDESPEELARLCDSYAPALALFDTKVPGEYGGTGTTFEWTRVAELARRRRVMVAGGLTPENVGACVRVVRPFAVDVRSGVESDGRKDARKMREFVRAVRENDAAA